MHNRRYHRAFGVYGIYEKEGKLLVINKNSGPYINRYDLPGGSLEEGETLSDAMNREFLEETGIKIEIEKNIGVIDFKLPWLWKDYTDVHHIAVYYYVRKIGGKLSVPKQFEGQDSLGALWISEKDANLDNASPLVLKAFEWLRTNELGVDAEIYNEWEVFK
ncbi:DNA mismatch repair protein MutT [Virgibacillus profundi]|uniref:DNA mismatch repair protein MutT n=1 Tax=Virgibacillus profundi TaxID=2024555 RepID=A0A2A2I9G8_9BACI|nr:NUDIX hydrolase [Virgibacillus profundi]PAV27956.1 DNA mismatch repair protein MutT [Virgibacillus profundi]PXY52134.1 NUDIX domain-containing protein [Virgibacillus profundi]